MLGKPHDWDTAQMPINVMDPFYRSFEKEVVPVCLKKNVGVIGMKGLGGGTPNGRFLSHAGMTSDECYRYCLSRPVSVQVVGINSMAAFKAGYSARARVQAAGRRGIEAAIVARARCGGRWPPRTVQIDQVLRRAASPQAARLRFADCGLVIDRYMSSGDPRLERIEIRVRIHDVDAFFAFQEVHHRVGDGRRCSLIGNLADIARR